MGLTKRQSERVAAAYRRAFASRMGDAIDATCLERSIMTTDPHERRLGALAFLNFERGLQITLDGRGLELLSAIDDAVNAQLRGLRVFTEFKNAACAVVYEA